MSSSLTCRSDLTTTFPALDPEISAHITDGLLAAVRQPDTATGDQFGHETTLIAEVDAFHPRDLEETVLVTQVLAAHHGALECLHAAGQCEVTSREASRLRRDAIAMQRSLAAMLRALHKSQARPVSEDDLVPRPAVPTCGPRRAGRGAFQPDRTEAAPCAQAEQDADADRPGGPKKRQPDQAGPKTAGSRRRGAAAASPPPAPKPRVNPFEGHPDLQRLNDRWYDLPRWEEMTMEERRETFGYGYTSKTADQSATPDQPSSADQSATPDQPSPADQPPAPDQPPAG